MAGIGFMIDFHQVVPGSSNIIECMLTDIKFVRLNEDMTTLQPFPSGHLSVPRIIRKDAAKYNIESPCPCGLHWTKKGNNLERRIFKDCCFPIWFDKKFKNISSDYEFHDEHFEKLSSKMYDSLYGRGPMIAPIAVNDERYPNYIQSIIDKQMGNNLQ